MVDVTRKDPSPRSAVATGRVLLSPHAFSLVASNSLAKGDVLTVAKLAGITGAKRTSDLIPLCHPISLTHVDVRLRLAEETSAVEITAEAKVRDATGVEMEALTAVSVAALTVYDMCKAVDKSIVISDVKLLSKSGGKSGDWRRQDC
jgi:molybdenum cofactor biosynthesis protein MoaC